MCKTTLLNRFVSFKSAILLFVVLFQTLSQILFSQQLKINELMSSNSITITDEDGDYSDWIEIFNNGTSSIDLGAYGLSDDPNTPFKWIFPIGSTINGGEYLIIWIDSKDRTNPTQPLHTNFGISAGGETIQLTDNNSLTVDFIPPVVLQADISFGRQPDNGEGLFYFNVPTPGSSNNTSVGYQEILAPPVFSHQGGFYSVPFNLSITHSDPEVMILYTTDGSNPDQNNIFWTPYYYKNQYQQFPTNPQTQLLNGYIKSNIYSESLLISDKSFDPDSLTNINSTYFYEPTWYPSNPVFKGTVIRARVYKPGALSLQTVTHTYFISSLLNERYSLPVISFSTDEKTFFDYSDGLYTAGIDFDNWRTANPNVNAGVISGGNYKREGDTTENLAHIEYYEKNNPIAVLNQDIGFRIHGGATVMHRIKSLRLYARSEYGNSSFNYAIFPDQPEYSSYKRLIMRNAGDDYNSTYLKDASIQEIVKHLKFDTQAYQPAIVFINGEYWGIHNIRERYDKYYLERVYGIDPENIDLLVRNRLIEYGDANHYNETINYITTNGLSDTVHYNYIKTRVDVDNFMDYQIAEIFAGNRDWPDNNIKYWRLRTTEFEPNAPNGQDGRWRWLMFDV